MIRIAPTSIANSMESRVVSRPSSRPRPRRSFRGGAAVAGSLGGGTGGAVVVSAMGHLLGRTEHGHAELLGADAGGVLPGDVAAVHHDDPVREAEDLVELGAHQHHAGTAVARLDEA